MPKFSILILTHDRLADVQHCFDSLRPTLARDDVDTWVLDNASTDGTLDYLAGLSCEELISLIESHKNLGVAGGRARLLEIAKGERIIFLDSDTVIVDQNWLEVLDKALEPENIGLVGPGGSFMLPDWSNFTAATPGRECDVVAGYCQVFKRETLTAGVHLDLNYGIYWTEDSDFCMQIREAGYDIWCMPVGILHEPGHSGSAATEAQLQKNLALFRSKWQGKGLTRAEGGY